MVPRIITSHLIFLLLFVFLLSSGTIDGLSNGMNSPTCTPREDHVKTVSRKLLSHDVVDYDDPGPNPRHDPRGRRWGGSKNP